MANRSLGSRESIVRSSAWCREPLPLFAKLGPDQHVAASAPVRGGSGEPYVQASSDGDREFLGAACTETRDQQLDQRFPRRR